MPIYEFYCSACHTLLNFFSASVDTDLRPDCPRCGARGLERKPARFATLGSGSGDEASGLDEARLEQAMAAMAGEFEAAGATEDPQEMGRMMRRFSEAAGLEWGPAMESLAERLAAGEDPDAVDADLASLDDAEGSDGLDALFRLKRLRSGRRDTAPQVDDELYFL